MASDNNSVSFASLSDTPVSYSSNWGTTLNGMTTIDMSDYLANYPGQCGDVLVVDSTNTGLTWTSYDTAVSGADGDIDKCGDGNCRKAQ